MSRASRGEGGDLPGGPCFFHDQENSGGRRRKAPSEDGTKKEQCNKYGVKVA